MRISIPIDLPGPPDRRHVVRSHCHTYDVRIVCSGSRVWFECRYCDLRCNPVLAEEHAAEYAAHRVLYEEFARIGESLGA